MGQLRWLVLKKMFSERSWNMDLLKWLVLKLFSGCSLQHRATKGSSLKGPFWLYVLGFGLVGIGNGAVDCGLCAL